MCSIRRIRCGAAATISRPGPGRRRSALAHRDAGQNRPLYLGHPEFEGFEVIQTVEAVSERSITGRAGMLIVDAQVHIWGPDTPQRPWPKGRAAPHRAQPFSRDDLLQEMDAAGVARVVIVPPSWEGDRNDLALAAARLHPDRFAVMGRPPAAAAPAR